MGKFYPERPTKIYQIILFLRSVKAQFLQSLENISQLQKGKSYSGGGGGGGTSNFLFCFRFLTNSTAMKAATIMIPTGMAIKYKENP